MRGYKEWKRKQERKSKVIVDAEIHNNAMKEYHVTIEQTQVPKLKRYFGIKENTETNENKRIVVSMVYYQKFLAHIESCLEWRDPVSSRRIKLNLDDAYTSTLNIDNDRAYEFDIYVKDGIPYMRINYMHKHFNSFVTIDFGSLEDIVKTIKTFEMRYRHLLTDDLGRIIRRDGWRNDPFNRCEEDSNRFFDTGVYTRTTNESSESNDHIENFSNTLSRIITLFS